MTSCSLGDAMLIGMGQEMPFQYVVDQLVSGFVGFFLPDVFFLGLFRQFFQDHFMIISWSFQLGDGHPMAMQEEPIEDGAADSIYL